MHADGGKGSGEVVHFPKRDEEARLLEKEDDTCCHSDLIDDVISGEDHGIGGEPRRV